MYLLKSKAPQISKNVPTLFFSAVFKMSKHDISTLLHWSTEKKNSHGLNYCTEAVKKTARVSFSSSNLHPSVPSWHSDLDVVIVDIRRQKFALDVTIGSYQDLSILFLTQSLHLLFPAKTFLHCDQLRTDQYFTKNECSRLSLLLFMKLGKYDDDWTKSNGVKT